MDWLSHLFSQFHIDGGIIMGVAMESVIMPVHMFICDGWVKMRVPWPSEAAKQAPVHISDKAIINAAVDSSGNTKPGTRRAKISLCRDIEIDAQAIGDKSRQQYQSGSGKRRPWLT